MARRLLLALVRAAERNDLSEIEVYSGRGGDIGAVDKDQNTLLHIAAAHGSDDVVVYLLSRGADPNAANCVANTPLHYAASGGHARAAELLLCHGADPSLKNIANQTAEQRSSYVPGFAEKLRRRINDCGQPKGRD